MAPYPPHAWTAARLHPNDPFPPAGIRRGPAGNQVEGEDAGAGEVSGLPTR
jgi:hypothetical protein